jgi:hypothetical protein
MYKNIQSLSIWPEKTFIDFILSAINQPLATSLRNAKKPLDDSNGCSANWLTAFPSQALRILVAVPSFVMLTCIGRGGWFQSFFFF